jgi:signal transduction histidine kinase
MQNRLIKQYFQYFVLPTVSFFLAFGIICLFLQTKIQIALLLSITLFLLALFNLTLFKKLSSSYREVEFALECLRKGEDVKLSNKVTLHYFSTFISSLIVISNRMKEQQEELLNERVQRLRSMIDGQDQERQRLSRELHDSIGQSLIAVKLHLENAGNHSFSQIRTSVDLSKDMIDQTIDEVRRVTNALMPAALTEFGLISALRTRCDEMANAAGLKASFENTGSIERLDDKSKTYLYRIAQEAMTNIIKHARASEMKITLLRIEQIVTLIITDDGKGFIFDPSSYKHRNGIQNIRERVALLDGSFELKSQPNAGTSLQITIPYKIGNGKNTNHIGG